MEGSQGGEVVTRKGTLVEPPVEEESDADSPEEKEWVRSSSRRENKKRSEDPGWRTERWTVSRMRVKEILGKLKCGRPDRDAFADSHNSRFAKWWGPGGDAPDAFTQNWWEAGLLWCNPPYSRLAEVIRKAIKGGGANGVNHPSLEKRPALVFGYSPLCAKTMFFRQGREGV